LYGSQKAVAERVGLSSEMVREFRKVLTLPQEVQDMLRTRQIDRLDVAYRISMLNDPDEQVRVARETAGLPTEDVRDVGRVVSTAGLSAEAARKKVLESKLEGLHVFVLDFDDQQYRAIVERANVSKTPPPELVKQVVLDWLAAREGEKRRGKRGRAGS